MVTIKTETDEKHQKNKTRTITISPITRLEGEGKISIFLDEQGNVDNAYFQVVEHRGFERFCQGRLIEEMPVITPKLCGVCPWAHHMASAKALDSAFGVEPTETAKKIRELVYCAHTIHSHIAHFFALSMPDFIIGSDAEPAKRNILGIAGVAPELALEAIKHRGNMQKIQEMIGGSATYPVCALPGGVSKAIDEDERKKIEKAGKEVIEFCKKSTKFFEDSVLKNKEYKDMIMGDTFYNETYYMSVVDKNNQMNLYDGDVRIVNPKGEEFAKFKPKDYLDHIEEHVEDWSYMKFAYLKKVGWKGLVDGPNSGVVRVNSLARLNASAGLPTPLAQEAYDAMYNALVGKGKRIAHNTLAFNWARLVEMMYASERMLELSQNKDITKKDVRIKTGNPKGAGIGIVEAPRGTLIHHYEPDEKGRLKNINLIVATGFNNAGICISVKKAAASLIKNWKVNNGLLNTVEMAFRAYDPCLACATHSLPGQMPMEITIYDNLGKIHKTIRRA